jgi:osmotically-inducible protein OsmY
MSKLTNAIEERLAKEAEVDVVAEEDGDAIVLTGFVHSEELHRAAIEIAAYLARGKSINDNIEINEAMPAEMGSAEISEVQMGLFDGATPELEEDEALTAGDFTDQETVVDALDASGPSGMRPDVVSEGDNVYVPPTDPVGNNTQIVGGFQSDSMEHIEVERSALDGQPGDVALADAVMRELREDASTTDLKIRVDVENGIARLRGTVPYLEDAENAEAVASMVPGIIEVREELKVEGM